MSFDRARIHWTFTLAGVCLVMGGLLAIQVRSNPPEVRWLSSRFGVTGGGPIGALSSQLQAAQQRLQDQTLEITDLRKQVGDYEQASSKEKDFTKLMAEQLANYKVALGLIPVEGPGITLEVDDSPLAKHSEGGGDLEGLEQVFLVHDTDLLQITNELWEAGAEAIAINNQRVVAGTAIRCVGPTTLVNNVSITAPYHFIALGDADTLSGALNLPGGVLDRLRGYKFRLRLEKQSDLTAPAISTAKKFQYAKPVEDRGAGAEKKSKRAEQH
jgi:uncharacterized protein YlxW (UPF0749 family)